MRQAMPLDRRGLLTGFALAAVSAGPAVAEPQPGLLVAGPPGGRLDKWAQLLAGMVGRGLPSRAPLLLQNVGGLDGVTGANQFEARGEPDGGTALLVPGSAALSWLVGETRAQFDPARWVPLWAAAGSAVLVSRVVLEPGRTLRVAAASPAGAELPVLLALDQFGVNAVLAPVQEADAVLIQGTPLPAALAASAAQGMNPVLTLGVADADGALMRDPVLPTIPTAFELAQHRMSAQMAAPLRAATFAVLLEAGLMLPQLTPAASISAWRRACAPLLNDSEMVSQSYRLGTRLVSGPAAAACMGQIGGDPAMLLTLRKWLTTRYDWQAA